ncbi:MAG: hypothetical protein WD266_07755 [Balneolales bacterium]
MARRPCGASVIPVEELPVVKPFIISQVVRFLFIGYFVCTILIGRPFIGFNNPELRVAT